MITFLLLSFELIIFIFLTIYSYPRNLPISDSKLTPGVESGLLWIKYQSSFPFLNIFNIIYLIHWKWSIDESLGNRINMNKCILLKVNCRIDISINNIPTMITFIDTIFQHQIMFDISTAWTCGQDEWVCEFGVGTACPLRGHQGHPPNRAPLGWVAGLSGQEGVLNPSALVETASEI